MNFNDELDKWLPDNIKYKAGCIVLHDGKILIIHTKKGYEIPKGGVKNGESITDAAIRETYEETGIQCKIISNTPIELNRIQKGYMMQFYLAVKVSGTLTPQTEEGIIDTKFIELDKFYKNSVTWQKPIVSKLKELL